MFLYNEWSRFLITDQELGQSYEIVGDLKRSWIKKHLAYLFSFYGHDPSLEKTRSSRQRAGFVHREEARPVPGAVIFADSYPGIWNRLLAAFVPAIAAGVGDISVFLIRGRGNTCPEILTALELAGIENIFSIDQTQAGSVADMTNGLDAVLMDLCTQSPVPDHFLQKPDNVRKYIRLFFDGTPRGLIWTGELEAWDYESVKWAHPDMEFTVGGPQADYVPPGFASTGSGIPEILEEHWDFFLGPEHVFRSSRIARGFSRGMEPFWIWPEIDKSFFMINRVYWKEID